VTALAVPLVRRRPVAAGWLKYVAIARAAFWQRLSERAVLIGRLSFYFIVLLVFSCVWRVLLGAHPERAGGGRSAADYVWYLALTEWIMLSQPAIYLEIESDVRSGDIAYQLARPMSYVGGKLAEALGDLLLRLLLFAPFGLGFARLLSGQWADPLSLACAALVGVLAAIVMQLTYASIGLSAFWLHDTTPVYLVWQKLIFVLGGLMVPLSLYPDWLQALARHLPFASFLYEPGRIVLEGSRSVRPGLLLELLGWLALAALVVARLERLGRRSIEVQGG
jgi:ABC-2 type transport system permease protein